VPLGVRYPPVAPVVGRRAYLDRCQHALPDALDGRPQVLLVQGEAGVGKTRLLKEVGAAARQIASAAELRLPDHVMEAILSQRGMAPLCRFSQEVLPAFADAPVLQTAV
jgi:Cdc6-like AAA superfamily ATPase